ncbi:hypothetical protein OROHE_016668 [Orobanche hederae]
MEGGGTVAARKVMVVADPTRESAGALQYALSHAVVENDTLILFHVGNPNMWKNPFGVLFKKPNGGGGGGGGSASTSAAAAAEGCGGGDVNFLDAMKQACMAAQPKVKVVAVKVEMTEGKDKAAVVLAHSSAHKVDLLIVGHKRSLSNAILGTFLVMILLLSLKSFSKNLSCYYELRLALWARKSGLGLQKSRDELRPCFNRKSGLGLKV